MSMKSTNRLDNDGEGCDTYLPKEETGISFPPDRTALLVIDPVNDVERNSEKCLRRVWRNRTNRSSSNGCASRQKRETFFGRRGGI